MSVFPSGRIINHASLNLERAAEFAEEFPTIIYFMEEDQ